MVTLYLYDFNKYKTMVIPAVYQYIDTIIVFVILVLILCKQDKLHH